MDMLPDDANHVCVCQPQNPCAINGYVCGDFDDGCGNNVNCGDCNQMCGGGFGVCNGGFSCDCF